MYASRAFEQEAAELLARLDPSGAETYVRDTMRRAKARMKRMFADAATAERIYLARRSRAQNAGDLGHRRVAHRVSGSSGRPASRTRSATSSTSRGDPDDSDGPGEAGPHLRVVRPRATLTYGIDGYRQAVAS